MKFHIITLFPNIFTGFLQESLLKKAIDKGVVEVKLHNLRDFTTDKHRSVDDKPFGGGPGMVLMVEPVDKAIQAIKSKETGRGKVIMLSPRGERFNQKKAKELANYDWLVLLAGRYEGFDERIRKYLVDEVISIGDYVLNGGEVPAMVVVEAVSRLLPGFMSTPESLEHESFNEYDEKGKPILDYPQYTRPANYKGWQVPKVLLSGDHKKIEKWRKSQAGLGKPDL
ncbi:MAG: tRNA (guanosine(37)-N1)-methyltransferase TrmD [bacterium]|nr:tRNA (guanosine(37)-N1)-methyltransferase TrmD [bacterium]